MSRRSWLLILTVAVMAAAPVAIVTRVPRAGAAGATLTVTPKCVNSGPISLSFSGTGFLDDATVYIRDEHQNDKIVALAGTNKSGSFTDVKTQPGSIPAKPTGYYWFRAQDEANGIATRAIKVPCPSLTIKPACGPVGLTPSETYDIVVSGTNFPPVLADVGSPVQLGFDQQPIGPPAYADENGAFTATIKVPRKAKGTHRVEATDQRDGNYVAVPFLVPCLEVGTTTTTTTLPVTETTATTAPPPVIGPAPTCVLEPPVGPPGFVTSAACQNFPDDATATLRWSPGLGATTAKVDGAGRFRVPVLILPHDVLGPRQLVAEAPGVSVKVPFLVTTPTVSPSGGDVATRRFGPQFVIRQ